MSTERIIGIFSNKGEDPAYKLFGLQGSLFGAIIDRLKAVGVRAYALSPDDVPATPDGQWYGWVHEPIIPDTAQIWHRVAIARPTCIYDRGLFTATTVIDQARRARAVFEKAKITLCKSPDFYQFTENKARFYEVASKDATLRRYIPETISLSGESMREHADFFERHASFVIKPERGQKGRNVIRVEKTPEGFAYEYRVKNGDAVSDHHGVLTSMAQLPTLIAQLPYTYTRYIAQQRIYPLRFRDRAFDVRMIFQRTKPSGPWTRTVMAVRLAAPGTLAANLSLGGEAVRLSQFVQECFGETLTTPGGIAEQLRALGRTLCTSLLTQFTANECAADVMIDTSKKLWLIEMNSKPDTGIFKALLAFKLRDHFIEKVCAYLLSV